MKHEEGDWDGRRKNRGVSDGVFRVDIFVEHREDGVTEDSMLAVGGVTAGSEAKAVCEGHCCLLQAGLVGIFELRGDVLNEATKNRGSTRDRSNVCVGEAETVDSGPTLDQKTEDRGANVKEREAVFAGVGEDMSGVLVDCLRFDMTGVAEEEGKILEDVHYYLLVLVPDGVVSKAVSVGELLEGVRARAVSAPRARCQVAGD